MAYLSLLFVDDDPIAREAAKAYLGDEVFSVTTVNDGAQACFAMNAQPFDLVVLDLSMPKLDGIDMLRYLRSHDAHRSVPTVVLTGSTDEATLADARAQGASIVSTKPVDWRALRTRLHGLVKDKLRESADPPLDQVG